ncbi:flagellar hook-length control protein FliK [Borrelia sp. P9F1]|uniref:flagellar hook-length control protein FliK n=1 Tax=Borrelia sp. P9F1 TaxID=3058374 RepID=UPI002647B5ED|nr:flagellar hook-length control protein FliK [Borrelia sp. P9F1]WKC57856.1 flagellar hook-length control protein FliK [Borrelia sp. P9F1]
MSCVLGKVVLSSPDLLSKGLSPGSLGASLGKGSRVKFLDLIFSEMEGASKTRGSVLDFFRFLKDNGLIDKQFKRMSLDRVFAFEKLGDDGFVFDLKSLIKKMSHLSDFENFRVLSENLSGGGFADPKEIIKNIEDILFDVGVFRDVGSFLGFDVLGVALSSNQRDFGLEGRGEKGNVIDVDVKNFKKSSGFKELPNMESKFRVVDGEHSVGKYSFKETFSGMGDFVGDLCGSGTSKYVKEPLSGNVGGDLMSEWDLKVNHNIVNKAKIVLKSNDTGEIKLIIKPRELGSIRINLNLDSGNNLLGRIVVDNQNVRALFEQNMYSISKMLDDNGFNTSLSLSLAGDSGSFSGFKDEDSGRGLSFGEGEVFRLEDDIEISDELEKNINFVV